MFKKVILVIEDDASMLSLLDTLIRINGYVALKAPNAERALHLIQSISPNLIIADVLMPGMNGFELCQRIRAIPHTATTPIIILTALNSAQSRQQAQAVGANAFVTKDDLSEALVSKIRALLNNGTACH
jgi:putative two-component system response regulator